MTNREFNAWFKREIAPALDNPTKTDLRVAWGDCLEYAHRAGEITDRQVNRWTGPKEYQPK